MFFLTKALIALSAHFDGNVAKKKKNLIVEVKRY